MVQIYKKFTDSQVKELINRYLKKELERKYIQEILGIKKRRFFSFVKQLRGDPENFSIQYYCKIPTRKSSKDIEKNIYSIIERWCQSCPFSHMILFYFGAGSSPPQKR